MLPHVQAFLETAARSFLLAGPVYEFGFTGPSAGQHGSLENTFARVGYIGCGLHQGAESEPLQDLTCLPFPDAVARTVVCVGALEHLFEPQQAVAEFFRILAPGGALLLVAHTDSAAGDDPLAYWKPTARAMQRLLAGLELTLVGWQGAEGWAHTLYGIGFKSPLPERAVAGTSRFLEALPEGLKETHSPLGWRGFFGWLGDAAARRRWRDYRHVAFTVHLSGRTAALAALPSRLPPEA